jgi:hypothetical protein
MVRLRASRNGARSLERPWSEPTDGGSSGTRTAIHRVPGIFASCNRGGSWLDPSTNSGVFRLRGRRPLSLRRHDRRNAGFGEPVRVILRTTRLSPGPTRRTFQVLSLSPIKLFIAHQCPSSVAWVSRAIVTSLPEPVYEISCRLAKYRGSRTSRPGHTVGVSPPTCCHGAEIAPVLL